MGRENTHAKAQPLKVLGVPPKCRPGTPKFGGFTRRLGPQKEASAHSQQRAEPQNGAREAHAPKVLGVTPKNAGPGTPNPRVPPKALAHPYKEGADPQDGAQRAGPTAPTRGPGGHPKSAGHGTPPLRPRGDPKTALPPPHSVRDWASVSLGGRGRRSGRKERGTPTYVRGHPNFGQL